MEPRNMNMRPMPKKDNSNGVIGGALGAVIGTALGATFGVGGAYAYNRLTEDNIVEPPVDPELMEPDEDVEVVEAEPAHHHVQHVHILDNVYVVNDGNDDDESEMLTPPEEPPIIDDEVVTPDLAPDEPYVADVSDNDDTNIEIVSYERITTDDGSQMDIARIIYQGHQAAIVDVNLDGWADALMMDEDGSGDISEEEFHPLGADTRIEMAPLAQAANYQPEDGDELGNDLPTAFVGTEPDIDTPPAEEEGDVATTNLGNGEEIGFDTYGESGTMGSDDILADNSTTVSDGTDDLILV